MEGSGGKKKKPKPPPPTTPIPDLLPTSASSPNLPSQQLPTLASPQVPPRRPSLTFSPNGTASLVVASPTLPVRKVSLSVSTPTSLAPLNTSSDDTVVKPDKRDLVAQEILDTEKSYVKSMKQLCKEFIEPLATRSDVLKAEDHALLFSNAKIITGLNEKFLLDVEKKWSNWFQEAREKRTMGDLFLTFAPYFKMYSQYATSYEDAQKTLANLMKNNSKFQSFLRGTLKEGKKDKDKEKEEETPEEPQSPGAEPSVARSLSFDTGVGEEPNSPTSPGVVPSTPHTPSTHHNPWTPTTPISPLSGPVDKTALLPSLLIMPIQRIPRYELLLKELLRRTDEGQTDHSLIVDALNAITEVAKHVNNTVREAEKRHKILGIEAQFVGNPEFLSPSRYFIKQGKMKKKGKAGDKGYTFFLFNDLLAYASKSGPGKYKLHRKVPVDGAFSVTDELPETGNPDHYYKIKIANSRKTFFVFFDSNQDKADWLAAFNQVVEEREHKIKTDKKVSVAPAFADSSEASKCKICATSFGLLKRKYNCGHCGEVCCKNCLQTKIILVGRKDAFGKMDGKKHRVCDACARALIPAAAKISANEEEEKKKRDEDEAAEVEEEAAQLQRSQTAEEASPHTTKGPGDYTGFGSKNVDPSDAAPPVPPKPKPKGPELPVRPKKSQSPPVPAKPTLPPLNTTPATLSRPNSTNTPPPPISPKTPKTPHSATESSKDSVNIMHSIGEETQDKEKSKSSSWFGKKDKSEKPPKEKTESMWSKKTVVTAAEVPDVTPTTRPGRSASDATGDSLGTRIGDFFSKPVQLSMPVVSEHGSSSGHHQTNSLHLNTPVPVSVPNVHHQTHPVLTVTPATPKKELHSPKSPTTPTSTGGGSTLRSVSPPPGGLSSSSSPRSLSVGHKGDVPPKPLTSPGKELGASNSFNNSGLQKTPTSPTSASPGKLPFKTGDSKVDKKEQQRNLEGAFKTLTDDSTAINWVLLGLPHGDLEVVGTGTGGVNEMKTKLHEDEVLFGALKVVVVEGSSSLPRYMGVTFTGKNVAGLKRGKAMGMKPQVNNIFKGLAITAECETLSQITPQHLGLQLKKAAATATYFDFFSDKIYLKNL